MLALVVSHADAEDLADRVRSRLKAGGALNGPAMSGPGWTAEREYRAGDRVLLHARCGPTASRLVNGTTATVTSVDEGGLTVRLDSGDEALLPARFVQGTRKDGSPNLSHAWARTVDGAQGGTWDACHLLGSSALDAYRGYTGQSRSRQPTHTWNTAKVAAVDHGGLLADQRGPAEQVAAPLAREPDPRLAARSDPWAFDKQLRDLMAEHERVLATRPPDLRQLLEETTEKLQTAEAHLAGMEATAARVADQLAGLGALSALSGRGREGRRALQAKLTADNESAGSARQMVAGLAARVGELRRGHDEHERFEAAESWRRDDLLRLQDQLDHHWAEVVTVCARADDPLAFGVDRLRKARTTVMADLQKVEDGIPADRGRERDEARRQIGGLLGARQSAEQAVAESTANREDASRRRWGRRDHGAVAVAQVHVDVAQRRLEEAVKAERDLRLRLTNLSRHQDRRQRVLDEVSPRRQQLIAALAQLDIALEHTRPERARDLADEPPAHLLEPLGQPPDSPAGRAVWCHHALAIEAARDRAERQGPSCAAWSQDMRRARQEIAIASQLLETATSAPDDPMEWATVAKEAAAVRAAAYRNAMVRTAVARLMVPAQRPGAAIEDGGHWRGTELGM